MFDVRRLVVLQEVVRKTFPAVDLQLVAAGPDEGVALIGDGGAEAAVITEVPARSDGVPATESRFLVSIPTPFNEVNSFVDFDSQAEVAYAYEQQLGRGVAASRTRSRPKTLRFNGIYRPNWRRSRAGSPIPTPGRKRSTPPPPGSRAGCATMPN